MRSERSSGLVTSEVRQLCRGCAALLCRAEHHGDDVSSARSTRCVWCSRLHYVAHRLTLGTAGLRELMCVEQKLLGHSDLASVSQSAAFAVPQMDFESELHGRSASFALRADKLVLQHLEVRLQLSE